MYIYIYIYTQCIDGVYDPNKYIELRVKPHSKPAIFSGTVRVQDFKATGPGVPAGRLAAPVHRSEGGRALPTEMLLPRIPRQGTVFLISIRG